MAVLFYQRKKLDFMRAAAFRKRRKEIRKRGGAFGKL